MSSRLSAGITCVLTLFAVLVGGCRSDLYYQNRAVERARSFLIGEAKELSAEEKYFITFNDPVFLAVPIIGSREFADYRSVNAPVLSDQINQICVSWKLPERDELYMVYGVSNGRMDFWHPERLIRKKFHRSDISGLEQATVTARKYARDNMFGLMDTAEQNFIRFHFPAVYATDFELNFNPTGKEDAEKIEKAKKLAEKSIQYSLVWAIPGSDELTIFCGTGGPEMKNWKLNFGGKTTPEDLARHTVCSIKTPEEFYFPFPSAYAAPEADPKEKK